MIHNVFLTGPTRQGKTTMLKEVLTPYEKTLGGFAIQRLNRQGITYAFRLLNLLEEQYEPEIEGDQEYDDIVIHGKGPGVWQASLHVFNDKGVQALLQALHQKSYPVIMDELGVFEEQALPFQQAVFTLLRSPLPVLGVIKNKKSHFLDTIRNHEQSYILPYTSRKRQSIKQALLIYLKEGMWNPSCNGHSVE